MNRLLPALAAVSALLLTTGAFAQTAPDTAAEQMWCGTALTVAFASAPSDATSDQMAQAQTYIDGGNAMIATATQAYLNAGFTEEQVTKVKTDLVAEVTPIVTGAADPSKAKYTFDQCAGLLPGASSQAPDASAPADDASSAPADASSSAQ
jgi:hypothetical protein